MERILDMKKLFGITLAIFIVMTTLCSCGGMDTNNTTGTDENGKITDDADKNAMDDMKDAVDDTIDGVKDDINDTTDAVDDALTGGKDKNKSKK